MCLKQVKCISKCQKIHPKKSEHRYRLLRIFKTCGPPPKEAFKLKYTKPLTPACWVADYPPKRYPTCNLQTFPFISFQWDQN